MNDAICLNHDDVIVVTGSTGWVGKTFISELQKHLSPTELASKLFLFSSRSGYLLLPSLEFFPDGMFVATDQNTLRVYPLSSLSELAASKHISVLFHAAFLTRDRIQEIGHSIYIQTNQFITSQVSHALARSPLTKVITISSGAASIYDTDRDPQEYLDSDPYGVLKHQEETILSKSVDNSLAIRIYALSGRYMHNPQRFALGSFLIAALQRKSVSIHSTIPVIRSYGFASDIARYALRICFSDSVFLPQRINAVSHTISLLDLANTVTRMYDLPPLQSNVDVTQSPNSYIADARPFLNQLHMLGFQPTPIEDQIKDTATGLILQTCPQNRS